MAKPSAQSEVHVDLSEMHAWPIRLGTSAEHAEHEAPEALTREGLVERCAQAGASWGESETKTASAEPALLFKAPDAHPFVLLLMVLDRYGNEALTWAPEVLRVTMIRDNLQVSGASFAKLMAMEAILNSPSPWRQWNVFHYVSRALAGLPPNFVYLEQPELGHQMVAVDIMRVCDRAQQTSAEVDKFVATTLRHSGHVYAPEPLSFAQRELEQPRLHCTSCGASFEDNNDQKCVTCGAAALSPVPYPYAELRDACAAFFVPRRELSLDRAVDGLPETPAGNLVFDLLPHWDHARRVRQQLLTQMRGLAK